MVKILEEQIKKFKDTNSNQNNKFILLEVGSYLGESLELFGDVLQKEIPNNFIIISVDPYIPYATDKENEKIPLLQSVLKKSRMFIYILIIISH